MSDQVVIEYRGYKIRFGENSGEWWCSDFNASNMDISKVKAVIDRHLLRVRKASSVDALIENGGFGDDFRNLVPVKIVEYLKPSKKRTGQFGLGEEVVEDHVVAVMGTFSGNDRASRREEKLSTLYKPGTFTDALAAEIAEERRVIEAARKRIHELREKIPRIPLDEIAELVKVAQGPEAS